ncbi:Uncharacterized protein TCM_002831 [Theobroma cacao]|uniref:Retrotransposon gag domain-containing protein n=1 Tax=Theobroma cacao TaxID=3641 RepID=A0A061DV23_THECC|nr:Uncharacterized protein TCM_002831 [Theobroma cacao]
MDGTFPCLHAMVPQEGINLLIMVSNPTFDHWTRQYQIHVIIFSATKSVVPFFASTETFFYAWNKITNLYANKSRFRMMNLSENVTKTKRTRSTSKYFQNLRSVANELALVNSPMSEEELVILAFYGIGIDFKKIIASVRAQESYISFSDYEELLKEQDTSSKLNISTAHVVTS